MATLSEAAKLYIDDSIASVRRDLQDELEALVEGKERNRRPTFPTTEYSMSGDQLGAFLQGLAIGSLGVFVLLRYFVK